MITEDQLAAYLAGEFQGSEKRRFENELAETPEMLRELVETEKFEVALTMLLARPGRTQLKDSILAVISSPAEADLKSRLYQQLEHETKRKTAPARFAPPAPSWLDWLKMCPRPVWISAAAFACLLLGLVIVPKIRQSQLAGRQQPFVPPFKSPPKFSGPLELPFAPDSPWNTPVQSHARYAEPLGLDLSLGATMVDAGQAHPTYYARSDDPVGELRVAGEPVTLPRQPLPLQSLTESRNTFAIVSADGRWIYDIRNGQVHADGIRADRISAARLDGSGIPPAYRAPTFSGLSEYAGSLCATDFRGPIRRALGAVFDPAALSFRPDGSLHVWPADPSTTRWGSSAASVRPGGNIHLGTRLAIPPDIDVAQIGVGSSGPAYEIAKAMQTYGVVLKHPYVGELQSQTRPGERAPIVFCGDLSNADLPPDFPRLLARAASFLKVVESDR